LYVLVYLNFTLVLVWDQIDIGSKCDIPIFDRGRQKRDEKMKRKCVYLSTF
jgi:hypothetical protein